MTLQQLRYVIAVADHGSMNEAAKALFISQPSLSGAVKELEKELGFELFLRTSRGIVVTPDGEEFLGYARQVTEQYRLLRNRYIEKESREKFSVSMQHYSFAVEAFITMAKEFNHDEYEFAVHETKTYEVIENVKNDRSEIGILYRDHFNQKALRKILMENMLEFTELFSCHISVYISKNHPLAAQKVIQFDALQDYPCLSFEQGEKNSFYFAEEMYSTVPYKQVIKADDRATMLNLMTGMNGYTLCSGIICGDLNGGNYVSIPLDTDEQMTVGYIKRKGMPLSILAKRYVEILKTYGK